MKLPGLNYNGSPLWVPASYASPGSAKTPDLGTPDCYQANSLRAGTLPPRFLGLTLSGAPSSAAPFAGMAEFGASQVDLFSSTRHDSVSPPGGFPVNNLPLFRAAWSQWNIYQAAWAAGVATLTLYLSGDSYTMPSVGQSVTVSGAPSYYGSASGYNGTFTITGVTGNTLTYDLAADPGVWYRNIGLYGGTAATGESYWGLTTWSEVLGAMLLSAAPNADAWANHNGPAPGCYPNRPNYPGGGTFAVSRGIITGLAVVNPGTQYSPGGPETLSGGHGSGATGNTNTVGNVDPNPVASEDILTGGTGYQVGDVLTVEDGNFDATVRVTSVDSTSYPYPSWIVTSSAWPHTGSGTTANPWTCPAWIQPDTYQLSVLLSWPGYYWAIWGKHVPLSRPWPDVMSLDGATLPLVAELATYLPDPQYGSPFPAGFSWAGSSVTLARIPKPAFPYY